MSHLFPKHLTLSSPSSPSLSSSSDRHTVAVNLARRYTVQNENDLMQEDMYDNTLDHHIVVTNIFHHPRDNVHDRNSCAQVASHLMHIKDLPIECNIYTDIVHELQRRDTDTTHPTQFLS